MKNLPHEITIRHSFQPGDIGYVTYLHGILYAKECGWDYTFESYVAGPFSEFARSKNSRERVWLVENLGILVGSIAIVEASPEIAQLRWFLLHPNLRGKGIGRFLLEDAIAFSRLKQFHSVYLWTEARLTAAAQLYRSTGFQLTEEKTHPFWGTMVTEQKYELTLI